MHVGGNNLSLPHLSLPDVGYLILSGTVALAGCVAANTQLLVIADGDDGYGNHLNIGHLTFDLERVALAELHIEDQAFPKRCGYIAGKRLVPPEAFAVALPALYNWYYDGKLPLLPARQIGEMGDKFVLLTGALYAVPKTLIEVYNEIKQHCTYLGYAERMLPFDAFNELTDLEKAAALNEKYSTALIFKQRKDDDGNHT
jgi:2-methylisocitrate lyase-like PEP mutase family enzyme